MSPGQTGVLPALVAVSEHGRKLASAVDGDLMPGPPRQALERAWRQSRPIVFFGAVGIAVRLLAPLITDKGQDPAVVAVDDAGRFAISLLSGHEGGANELARQVAAQLGAQAVITTASEVLPEKDIVLGIGCSKGAAAEDVEAVAKQALEEGGASIESAREIATLDLKAAEPGLVAFAERWHLPIRSFSARELAAVDIPHPSQIVLGAVGTPSVAEAAALLAGGLRPEIAADREDGSVPARRDSLPRRGALLVVPKRKSANVTAAVARVGRRGRVDVVGLGPGSLDQLTRQAMESLRAADVIVGYSLYVDMVRQWLPLAQCEGLPLGEEVQRARRAIDLARQGRRVALVCSGDAGIYGLAGLLYEELDGSPADLDVEVLPGVTAASSAAALLGAPLMADFAAISLSDLLTPTELILGRLEAAAQADLVVVLYNPASQRRRSLLVDTQRIFLGHRQPGTPVGLVRQAYRPEQSVRIVELASLPLDEVDMFTVVVVGSSQTSLLKGRMVTRRRLVPATNHTPSRASSSSP
ncbi:MAG: precorrin-3B C(17)-methyltransferase [Chloroflexota bacterium]